MKFLLTNQLVFLSAFLFVAHSVIGTQTRIPVTVEIPGYGPATGDQSVTPISGRVFQAFKGIPYSRAGRFEDFADPPPWTDPWNALNFGPSCHNPGAISGQSENCLTINVWTSNLSPTKKVPVVVYIHGGGYVYGVGDVDPVYFLDAEEIVFVSFNYRLGTLGFLYSDHPAVNLNGNYGVKDQIQALKWVQRTISAFGGDPDDVTLIGVSAGGSSVHDLLLVPHETEGIIHKAISISGAALCPWAVQKNPADNFIRLAQNLGCLTESEPSSATLDCLMSLEPEILADAALDFTVWYGLPFVFVPVENDGTVFRGTFESILDSGNFLQIPWLAGNTRDEGSLLIGDSLTSVEVMEYLNDNWQSICPGALDLGALSEQEASSACRSITDHYMGSDPITYNTYYNFLKLGSDRLFDIPMQRSAERHAKFAPFYGYRFNYQGIRGSLAHYYDNVPAEVPRLSSFVSHAENYPLIFGDAPLIEQGDPDEFAKNLHFGALMNFIKTGVPVIPETVGYDLEWPLFTESQSIQVVDVFPRTTRGFVSRDEDNFWASLGL